MTELMVLAVVCALGAVAVFVFVARAGRQADREHVGRHRRDELDALARIHDRRRDG